MIYDVRQITTYRYASAVANARHLLRLTPIDRNGQRVLASTLGIEPEPVERREGSHGDDKTQSSPHCLHLH